MDKKFIGVAILILVIAAIAVALRYTPGSEGMVITTEDGLATFEIPDGALPEGVSIEDITISRTPIEELTGKSIENAEDVIAYKMKPDGLEFKKPVTVTISQEQEEFEGEVIVPVLLHGSDEGIDLVDNTHITLDAEKGERSISGEIDHFSWIASDDATGIFVAEIKPWTASYLVGEDFLFTFEIRHRTPEWYRENRFRDAYAEVSVAPDTLYEVRMGTGRIGATQHGILDPQRITADSLFFRQGQNYRIDERIACVGSGQTTMATSDITIEFTPHVLNSYVVDGKLKEDIRIGDPRTTHIDFMQTHLYDCFDVGDFEEVGGQYFIVCPSGQTLTGYGTPPPCPGE